jgi:integrase/recombinase XerD
MSALHQILQDYLAMRRGLGFKLYMAGLYLQDFVSFLETRQAKFITITLALAWAQQPRAADPSWWAQRLSYVRGFARYCSAIDPRTEIPPVALLPFHGKRANPYFYTDEEIKHLLQAALAQPAEYGLQGWTYYCLLGLLTVTGLRIGEAIKLTLSDVDLKEGILMIRATKFGKSRLVPLHSSTQDVLAEYLQHRQRFLAGRAADTLFVNLRGSRLEIGQVQRVFRRLSRQVGVRAPTARHGPRLHDLRHRFASATLLQWYRDGQDVERRLPVLSAYLGHANPSDTYWYLSAIPELLGCAKARLEGYWEQTS